MPSESTRALGQPSEMNPTFGAAAIRMSGFFFLAGRLLLAGRLRAARRSAEPRHPGESGKGEAGEHVARLVLQLFLHLLEHVAALFHVRRDHGLHRRTLEAHELLPKLLVELGGFSIELLRLLPHTLLDFAE